MNCSDVRIIEVDVLEVDSLTTIAYKQLMAAAAVVVVVVVVVGCSSIL